MRQDLVKRLRDFRIRSGLYGSTDAVGRNGMFRIPYGPVQLLVMVSDGSDWEGLPGQPWEHVSVSLDHRCPTWDEMAFIKRLCWSHDETVMQLHVPEESHVNFRPHCLHLWKPLGTAIPTPPAATVGPKA